MFLSKEELVELTNRHRCDCQIKMLRGMGIEHRVRADGSIAVLTAHVKQVFGLSADTIPTEQRVEPHWDMVNA
jgi:hypothetical protein